MSNPCKDCKENNCIKHNKIIRPDYFVLGIDNIRFIQYIIPVNAAMDIGLKKWYTFDERSIWFTAASPDYTLESGTGIIYKSLEDALDGAYAFAEANPPVDAVNVFVENPNYGNPIMTHTSFLKWKWIIDERFAYNSLKDPIWNISFPECTTKDKHNSNNEWRLKDCGIWKIEYRLRVRPIIPLSTTATILTCNDYNPGITESYQDMKEIMRFYKSLESQESSKALGIAPMRLESGIYSHDTGKYKPIVWSDGTYPQIIPNSRNYWSSKYPKEMSLLGNLNIAKTVGTEPPCERKTWHIDGPDSIIIPDSISLPNDDYIFYKYDNNATTINKGLIIPGTNNLINPGTLTFSNIDNIGKDSLLQWLKTFDLSGSPTKVGEIQIDIEGKLNGNWEIATSLNYDISNITFNFDNIVLNVTSNPQNPIEEDNLGAGYSNTQFYSFDNIQTRYSISISNLIPGDTLPAYDPSNVVPRTYTPLTEDFVVELEGFTYVNLDKEKEVSIYLKVLPEHNDHGSLGINPTDSPYLQPWYSTVGGNSNVQVGISTSPIWPWAPLSVDRRTKYTEQLSLKYEPFLPLDPYWENQLNLQFDIRRNLRYPDQDIHWYIMIEEGWVSAEKVCEDCNC